MEDKTLGGKAIGAGGFGCVFYPALKCENTTKRSKNKISKLLDIEHANQEYEEIKLITPFLKNIPNYSDFFLIDDIELCKPHNIQSKDLIGVNEKCNDIIESITKSKESSSNVNKAETLNKELYKYKIINMKYGGIIIRKYVDKYIISDTTSMLLNSLSNLLLNGIIPMNKLEIYHGDIKESNVLVNVKETALKPRLIDWGLTIIYSVPTSVPIRWTNRPLQFNVPFSNIIFSNMFQQDLNKFMNEKPINKSLVNCEEFMKNYLEKTIKRRPGHHSYIQYIFYILFDSKSEYENIIINYNASIIFLYLADTQKYKNQNHWLIDYLKYQQKFNNKWLIEYLNTIYKHNLDIWGFVMIYLPFLEMVHPLIYKYSEQLTPYMLSCVKEIRDQFKYIFVTHLYNTSTTQINVNTLLDDLYQINELFSKLIESGFNPNNIIKLRQPKLYTPVTTSLLDTTSRITSHKTKKLKSNKSKLSNKSRRLSKITRRTIHKSKKTKSKSSKK